MYRGILHTAIEEFKYFFINSKMILFLFAVIFICETLLSKVVYLCKITGLKVSFLEPYMLLASLPLFCIFIPLVFLVLISGFPSSRSFNYFSMIRISRMQWFLGEIIFIVVSSVVYMFFLLVSMLIYMRGHFSWINKWSEYMMNFRTAFPDEYIDYSAYFLQSDHMTHGKPLTVFIHSITLMICLLLMMALIQLTFSIINQKFLGMLFSFGITLISGLLLYNSGSAIWLFPMPHTNFPLHFDGFRSGGNFSILGSYGYFLSIILILLIADGCLLKKCRIGEN